MVTAKKPKGEPWPAGSCVECEPGGKRPVVSAPNARIPLCATHAKAKAKAQKAKNQARYLETTYGLTEDEYWDLYRWQGGRCYVCQWASGAVKRLAVDHDHACCPGPVSCGACVRGLLCGPCNKDVIGRLGPDGCRRAASYQETPPARLWRAGLPGVVLAQR